MRTPRQKPASFFLAIALALGAGPVLQSCLMEESPLSEVEISDPALISPRFTLRTTKNLPGGDSIFSVQAELFDGNGERIELLYGYVTINGLPLRAFNDYSSTTYHLVSSSIRILPDSLYTFTVKLSDGQTYSSSLRTPKTNLLTATVSQASDILTLAWTGNSTENVTFTYYTEKTNPGDEDFPTAHEKTFAPSGGNTGSVELPKGRVFTGEYRASVTMQGSVHPAFRAGGWIRNVSEIEHR
jgi:hypothetical protein